MRLEAYEEARHPTKNNKLQAMLQGPFIVVKVHQFGIVELKQFKHGRIHQIHGQKFIYFKDNLSHHKRLSLSFLTYTILQKLKCGGGL